MHKPTHRTVLSDTSLVLSTSWTDTGSITSRLDPRDHLLPVLFLQPNSRALFQIDQTHTLNTFLPRGAEAARGTVVPGWQPREPPSFFLQLSPSKENDRSSSTCVDFLATERKSRRCRTAKSATRNSQSIRRSRDGRENEIVSCLRESRERRRIGEDISFPGRG